MSSDDGNVDTTNDASKLSLTEAVFQDCINEKLTCTCFLNNGIKLIGKLLAYDGQAIILHGNDNPKPFVVNRASIATFLPYVGAPRKDEGRTATYGRP